MSRRGRKRITTHRYPGGKPVPPSTAERERDIIATGLEARIRLYGLSPIKASHPAAGSVFGRAFLAGELHPHDSLHNQALYDAGLEFERRRRAYRKAIAAMRLPSAADLDRRKGYSELESAAFVEACQHAMRAYAEIRTAILECGQPLAMLALECWILEDTPMHIGPLRAGLNAIWRVVHNARQRPHLAA